MSGEHMSMQRRSLLGAAMAAPLMSVPAWAQGTPAAIPMADFLKPSSLGGAQLSPDGKTMAALRDVKGRRNIVVVDLATRKATIITSFTDGDVAGISWINDNRLLFSIYDRERGSGDQIAGGLFAINKDASDFRQLSERSWVTEGQKLLPSSTHYMEVVLDGQRRTDDILVSVGSYQARGRSSSNVYQLNTLTGRSRLLTLGGPGDVFNWVLDTKQVPRVASSMRDDVVTIHVRDSAEAPWREVLSYNQLDTQAGIHPLEFDAEGNLYVAAYAGNDTTGIYRMDMKTGELSKDAVAALKGYDLDGGLIFTLDGKELLGVGYEASRPGVYWINERRAAIQAAVDKELPGKHNSIQVRGPKDAPIVLVASSSDRDPGSYFLFDVKAGTFEGVGRVRPWIKPEQMRPTSFFRYPARDGLSIPGQLTLPAGEGKFPLIVLHYGGPWVRPIHWGFDPYVQFLASRGYAVFMPAPRASTGFGFKLFKAGWKQWGLGMQDDVADGVKYLIDQGKIDGNRVCIMGASYGGYMTMMGLVKEPKLYKCGINWIGVTDPSFMFTVTWTDFNRFGGSGADIKAWIGDPEKDAEQFRQTSAVHRAAEIKQPVLMAYGGLDVRVPLINGEKMRDALRPHNQNVEWVVYPDEAHGGWRFETDMDFMGRVEKFLAKNL
ncbi:MAG TPA: prolyl oligopeptidase family serine peptidase [Burkholderiaceae bacterium]|nr:prolyl oligopeptidase family serine peptidase [Burkholderiaceae bacterium]